MAKSGKPSILIIRLGAIGDVVNTAPAAEILRERFPRAHIAWLVEDRASDVVDLFSAVDEKIVFERRRWSSALKSMVDVFGVLGEVGRFLTRLRHPRFDVSLDFQANLKGGVLGYLASAKVRVGYAEGFCREGNYLLTQRHYAPSQTRVRRPDRHLALLRYFDIDAELQQPRIHVPEPAREHVREFIASALPAGRPIVAIHAGASDFGSFKRWPEDKFALLADRLIEDLGCAVVFTWGPGERKTVDAILGRIANGACALPPEPSMLKMAALFQASSLMIGGDSGPLHLAAAVGAPVVGIYGPKDPGLYAPTGERYIIVRPSLPCGPCTRRTCPGAPCMRSIRVQTVLAAARAMLAPGQDEAAMDLPQVRAEEAGFHCKPTGRKGQPPYRVQPLHNGLMHVACGPYRGVLDAAGAHHELLARLGDPRAFFTADRAEWLVNDHQRQSCRAPIKVELGEHWVHVNRHFYRRALPWLARWIHPSDAAKSWRAARSLAAAGIATPKPLAWVERRASGPHCESVLATDEVPNSQTLRELLDAPELPQRTRGRLIELAAQFVADFHLAGYSHGDLKIRSLLAQEPLSDSPKMWLLDLSQARRTRLAPSSLREVYRVRDLRTLNRSLHGRALGTERARFLILYARRMGWSRRRMKTVAAMATALAPSPRRG